MIILTVLLVIVGYMSLTWLWYRYTNNPGVVDVAWSLGLTLCGLIYMSQQSFSLRTALLSLLLLTWGIRLAVYLWWNRVRLKHVDKRYLVISQKWNINKHVGFFINFQFQGVLIFIISLCWYFTALNPSNTLNYLEWFAVALFIISFTLEIVADNQLQHFKKEHPGAVCNHKLWKLSRHPNLFFEWLIWCSFALFALSSPLGYLALLSPIALYLMMIYLTIPITEDESIKSRGQSYLDYQKVTPLFFPKYK
ncbi:MAG: DUF1295 domain-containing protein [Legionella sp.]|nr:MAG: DUF1295 domain-containing protein [Legionella sp.]